VPKQIKILIAVVTNTYDLLELLAMCHFGRVLGRGDRAATAIER
jgi:hypothetical protein